MKLAKTIITIFTVYLLFIAIVNALEIKSLIEDNMLLEEVNQLDSIVVLSNEKTSSFIINEQLFLLNEVIYENQQQIFLEENETRNLYLDKELFPNWTSGDYIYYVNIINEGKEYKEFIPFSISSYPDIPLEVNICDNKNFNNQNKIFMKKQDIFLNINNPLEANIKIVLKDENTKEIIIENKESFTINKPGSYTLEVSVSKQGYEDKTTITPIQILNKEITMTKERVSYHTIIIILAVVVIIILAVFFFRKNLFEKKPEKTDYQNS
ncbi:MAG: hypothetical protein ABIC91_06665 [Nanoarchaeota archaeon]|nr:hypothetical protein [Nanoarchaeota archaeon]MBU1029676.1 hypothetical protein [Nanoarchaeota archaeon]MBU1850563.1 hypothetical protein [Nanoarchaeota archaeon]